MSMTDPASETVMVKVTCGSCGTKLQAAVTAEGTTIKCTRCGTNLRVQAPPQPPPAAPSPPPAPPSRIVAAPTPAESDASPFSSRPVALSAKSMAPEPVAQLKPSQEIERPIVAPPPPPPPQAVTSPVTTPQRAITPAAPTPTPPQPLRAAETPPPAPVPTAPPAPVAAVAATPASEPAAPAPTWQPTPPAMESQSRFVPYLSDPTFLDDDAADRAAAAAEKRANAERAAAAKRRAAARITAFSNDDNDEISDSDSDSDSASDQNSDDAPADASAARGQGGVASWTKALILTAAMVVIGAFAWYAAERFVGPAQWMIKFSCVAWLIGMATATAMLGAARSGPAAKILAALGAVLAITLGKALLLSYPDLAPELAHFTTAQEMGRTFAQLAFKPIDGLFAALALMGLAARFILSGRDA